MKRLTVLTLICLFSLFCLCAASEGPTAPKLTNNPVMDVVVTTTTPMLTFFNAEGGIGKKTYTVQLDRVPTFDSPSFVEYQAVPEIDRYIAGKRVEPDNALEDNCRYYWRVKSVDSAGNEGPWAWSRFYVNTGSDDAFMNLGRIPVKDVAVSSGRNSKNIIDIDDPGQATFWQAAPPGQPVQWVRFDLGEIRELSRIWILSRPSIPQIVGPKLTEPDISFSSGWLRAFVWQTSADGMTWKDIPGTRVTDNDTYRNIVDFKPVNTRFVRLLIEQWYGYAPQINAVILYAPGKPPIPEPPASDYVLIVGNQQSGATFTELKQFVEQLDLGLAAFVVPHYQVCRSVVDSLKRKPVAIILSGNDTGYAGLPMFEYNGEFELIRDGSLPILGICCGHQLTHMAYGYTNVRAMGWSDFTCVYLKKPTPIRIVQPDPLFKGIQTPFTAPEVHSWAVIPLKDRYKVLAESGYIQSIKSTSKTVYGVQFHPEINVPYNEAKSTVVSFLTMALKGSGAKAK